MWSYPGLGIPNSTEESVSSCISHGHSFQGAQPIKEYAQLEESTIPSRQVFTPIPDTVHKSGIILPCPMKAGNIVTLHLCVADETQLNIRPMSFIHRMRKGLVNPFLTTHLGPLIPTLPLGCQWSWAYNLSVYGTGFPITMTGFNGLSSDIL